MLIANLLSLDILFATLEKRVVDLLGSSHSTSRLVGANDPEGSAGTMQAETAPHLESFSASNLEADKQDTRVVVDQGKT